MPSMTQLNHEFTEAEEIIEFFLSDDMFRTTNKFDATITGKAGWLFRGQSNSDWELYPSAFRSIPKTPWEKYTPQPPPTNTSDTKSYLFHHLHSEAMAINIFLENADSMGIPTPLDYSISKRSFDLIFDTLTKETFDFDAIFPTIEFQRSTALAQHYGVPTRFLDWSESPLVACYFAAEQVSSISQSDCSNQALLITQKIAVTFLNVWPIKDESPIEIIKAPRHENSNLLNQKGVFINFKRANSFFLDHNKWPTLNDYSPPMQLHRALLPANKADDLLRLLFDLGITRYSLNPSLTNAAKAYEYMHCLFSISPSPTK